MRIPYYLAQYHQSHTQHTKRTSTALPVILVGGIVLLYVGTLAVLLLGGWS